MSVALVAAGNDLFRCIMTAFENEVWQAMWETIFYGLSNDRYDSGLHAYDVSGNKGH